MKVEMTKEHAELLVDILNAEHKRHERKIKLDDDDRAYHIKARGLIEDMLARVDKAGK